MRRKTLSSLGVVPQRGLLFALCEIEKGADCESRGEQGDGKEARVYEMIYRANMYRQKGPGGVLYNVE